MTKLRVANKLRVEAQTFDQKEVEADNAYRRLWDAIGNKLRNYFLSVYSAGERSKLNQNDLSLLQGQIEASKAEVESARPAFEGMVAQDGQLTGEMLIDILRTDLDNATNLVTTMSSYIGDTGENFRSQFGQAYKDLDQRLYYDTATARELRLPATEEPAVEATPTT